MPFDGILIDALITELRAALVGKRIEKISQPHKDAIRIGFRQSALFISVEASMSYFTLTENSFENPSEPPMFTMLLRKHLGGAVLEEIRQHGLDRVTRFSFSSHDPLGDRRRRHIVVENMGRHSNLFLLDESDRIIDSIKRVSLDESRERRVFPGTLYRPITSARGDIRLDGIDGSEELGVRDIIGRYEGFSPLSASYLLRLLSRVDRAHAVQTLFAENRQDGAYILIDEHEGKISKDFYHIREALTASADAGEGRYRLEHWPTISQAVDRYYARSMKELKMHQSLHSLKKIVSTRIERLRGKMIKLRGELEETERADEFRTLGELLTANLYQIPHGANRAYVTDYRSGEPRQIEIPLDTRLTPSENAQAFFRRYRKLRSGADNIQKQIEITERDIAYLENTLNLLDHSEDFAAGEEIRSELVEEGLVRARQDSRKSRRKKTEKKPSPSFLRFTTSDGLEVLVGKSNSGNDQLSLKFAEKNDLWFHAKDFPSAHVVLRTSAQNPPEQSVLEAAMICASYSRAKLSPKVAVDFCPAKFVRKPSGAKSGMVIYSNHRTLIVAPDLSFVEALRKK